MISNLGDSNKTYQNQRYDHINPKEPSEKNEIRCDGRTELRFDLFNPLFPRYQHRLIIDYLTFVVLPILRNV